MSDHSFTTPVSFTDDTSSQSVTADRVDDRAGGFRRVNTMRPSRKLWTNSAYTIPTDRSSLLKVRLTDAQ